MQKRLTNWIEKGNAFYGTTSKGEEFKITNSKNGFLFACKKIKNLYVENIFFWIYMFENVERYFLFIEKQGRTI